MFVGHTDECDMQYLAYHCNVDALIAVAVAVCTVLSFCARLNHTLINRSLNLCRVRQFVVLYCLSVNDVI